MDLRTAELSPTSVRPSFSVNSPIFTVQNWQRNSPNTGASRAIKWADQEWEDTPARSPDFIRNWVCIIWKINNFLSDVISKKLVSKNSIRSNKLSQSKICRKNQSPLLEHQLRFSYSRIVLLSFIKLWPGDHRRISTKIPTDGLMIGNMRKDMIK